eukprot:SM000300S11727  [mRNA]  locus=s300:105414:111193:- [translate_table: standard]
MSAALSPSRMLIASALRPWVTRLLLAQGRDGGAGVSREASSPGLIAARVRPPSHRGCAPAAAARGSPQKLLLPLVELLRARRPPLPRVGTLPPGQAESEESGCRGAGGGGRRALRGVAPGHPQGPRGPPGAAPALTRPSSPSSHGGRRASGGGTGLLPSKRKTPSRGHAENGDGRRGAAHGEDEQDGGGEHEAAGASRGHRQARAPARLAKGKAGEDADDAEAPTTRTRGAARRLQSRMSSRSSRPGADESGCGPGGRHRRQAPPSPDRKQRVRASRPAHVKGLGSTEERGPSPATEKTETRRWREAGRRDEADRTREGRPRVTGSGQPISRRVGCALTGLTLVLVLRGQQAQDRGRQHPDRTGQQASQERAFQADGPGGGGAGSASEAPQAAPASDQEGGAGGLDPDDGPPLCRQAQEIHSRTAGAGTVHGSHLSVLPPRCFGRDCGSFVSLAAAATSLKPWGHNPPQLPTSNSLSCTQPQHLKPCSSKGLTSRKSSRLFFTPSLASGLIVYCQERAISSSVYAYLRRGLTEDDSITGCRGTSSRPTMGPAGPPPQLPAGAPAHRSRARVCLWQRRRSPEKPPSGALTGVGAVHGDDVAAGELDVRQEALVPPDEPPGRECPAAAVGD